MKLCVQISSFIFLFSAASVCVYYAFFAAQNSDDLQMRSADLLEYNENLSYAEFVQNVHNKFLSNTNGVKYFDNAKRALYTTEQVRKLSNRLQTTLYGNPHSESQSSERANDIIEDMRYDILEYFNADLSDYTVVYTHSNTQSLKLIGESFPFTDKSTLYYSTTSSEDILGLRSFAKGHVASFSPNDITFSKIKKDSNNLIVVPLVDELTGECLTDEQIRDLKSARKLGNYTAVMVDASLYLATHTLDLSKLDFDCITVSLDHIIGYPSTSIAIIRNNLIRMLEKPYFGGGTLVYALTTQPFEKLRIKPAQRLEDGSLPFLTLAVAEDAFDLYKTIAPRMAEHTEGVAKLLRDRLEEMNETVVVYGQPGSSIVSFSVKKDNDFVDWEEVVSDAKEAGFVISGGCQRTPGTCNSLFNAKESTKQLERNQFNVVRASVGWLSSEEEVNQFADWIEAKYQNNNNVEEVLQQESEEKLEKEEVENPEL